MITPPVQEFGERVETIYCGDIACAAQHTVHIKGLDVSQEQIDREFSAAGWRDRPFLGQWLCPKRTRGATARLGALRDVDTDAS